VSAERAIWRGQAKSVVAKTPDGEIGILPGHSPVLALLLDAPLRIETTEGTKVLAAVHGGFFSVDSDTVNVIAETAELAEEIDVVRAKAALDRARSASAEDDPAVAAAKRAETRLAVAVGSR
jgi:F-type H+-transporting ATPase subunit epsilon